MKRKMILILLSALILMMGCTSQLFHTVATFNLTRVIPVDQTGYFRKAALIAKDDVLAALGLPEKSRIKKINIETLTVSVTKRSGNTATALKVSGTVYEAGNPAAKEFMFKDYPVPLPTTSSELANYGITMLIEKGINKLKQNIQNFATKLGQIQGVYYEIEGDTNPAGQKIALDIALTVNASIEYDYCADVLSELFSGEKCDIE